MKRDAEGFPLEFEISGKDSDEIEHAKRVLAMKDAEFAKHIAALLGQKK